MWAGLVSVGFFITPIPKAAISASCKIERDQVEDYARRKGWTVAEAERWLGRYSIIIEGQSMPHKARGILAPGQERRAERANAREHARRTQGAKDPHLKV